VGNNVVLVGCGLFKSNEGLVQYFPWSYFWLNFMSY